MDSSSRSQPAIQEMPEDQLLAELTRAALLALDRGEVCFIHYRGQHSTDRRIKKIRESLASKNISHQKIGLEFFRQAHEAWAVEQGYTTRDNDAQSQYWQIWREWNLLVLSPNSELHSMQEHDEFLTAFERLPHEQQEWLDLTCPRQPTTDDHMSALIRALADLDALLYHRALDDAEEELLELVGAS